MTTSQCQSIRKSDRSQCPNPATYDFDDELVCGIHAAKRRDPKYLIANKVRATQNVESTSPDQISTTLSGLLLTSAVCEIEYRGIKAKTVEHLYQMMKFYYVHDDSLVNDALAYQVFLISKARDASEARRLGHERKVKRVIDGREVEVSLPIRPDWNSRGNGGESGIYSTKDCFMFDILVQKFRPGSKAAQDLLATGDCDLIDNSNGGNYWCNGTNGHGRNRMGELLTMLRTRLSEH